MHEPLRGRAGREATCGRKNHVTLCELGILVNQAPEAVSAQKTHTRSLQQADTHARSRIKNVRPSALSSRFISRWRGLLKHPPACGAGDAGQVDAPGAVPDEEQDVQAAQERGTEVGEVGGEDRRGPRGARPSHGTS
jgi:hypothetical protein